MTPSYAATLLKALAFAADKHRDHRPKDAEASPYINHPIAVAEILARVAGVDDVAVLQAALLHEILEDTRTPAKKLEAEFGPAVRALAKEVSDNKRLSKEARKQRQIDHTPHLSQQAKLIKIADKISNVRDVTHAPPKKWDRERRAKYVEWAAAVVAACGETHPALERAFDEVLRAARAVQVERQRG